MQTKREKAHRVKAQEFKVINPVSCSVCANTYGWGAGVHNAHIRQKEITMRGPLGYTEFANLFAIEKPKEGKQWMAPMRPHRGAREEKVEEPPPNGNAPVTTRQRLRQKVTVKC